MRLLNVKTLEIDRFNDEAEIPEYAMLSHTWEKDEIDFQRLKQYLLQAAKDRQNGTQSYEARFI